LSTTFAVKHLWVHPTGIASGHCESSSSTEAGQQLKFMEKVSVD